VSAKFVDLGVKVAEVTDVMAVGWVDLILVVGLEVAFRVSYLFSCSRSYSRLSRGMMNAMRSERVFGLCPERATSSLR
jgi:hypothetical protein